MSALSPTSAFDAGWRGWLAAAVGLLLIYGAIDELVDPTPERSEPSLPTDTVRVGDAGRLPFGEPEAQAIASHLPHDVGAFRSALEAHRGAINVTLWARTAEKRTAWKRPVELAINWGALVFLLLLLGPLVVYLRASTEVRRGREAWRSVPYFVVAAAGSMMVVNGLASVVIEIQFLQIIAASFGALDASLTDATIHLIIDDVAATRVIIDGLLAPGFREDPLAVMTFYQSAWAGLAELRESTLLDAATHTFHGLGWLVDLYGPLLALLVLGVLGRVGAPLVRRLLSYPRDVLEGVTSETPGSFLWSQTKRVFGELRIAVWMVLFILLLTALAVVIVRVAAFPTASLGLHSLASATLDMRGGGELPEVALLLSAASLGLYMATTSLACLLPVGVILGKAYQVLRARHEDKRRFKDFPRFWRTARDLLLRVTLPAVLAATLAYLVVAGLAAWLGVGAHGWLPALAAPLLGVALWRLRSVARLKELATRRVV